MPARRDHQAVLHRPALPGVEAMTLRSGIVFPRHAHDSFGIGVLTEGAQRAWSGIGTVEAEAGDVITANPGEMHDGAPIGDRPRAWRILYLDPRLVARIAAEDGMRDVEIARPALRDEALAARIDGLFRQACAPRPDPLAAEQELVRMLAALLRRHGARRAAAPGPSPCVARAKRRLEEAPERAVTLAELAALTGASRFQLLRGFARELGATPHAYLLQLRVRRARHLLAAGATPAEAALGAGFADQSHLTRAFARQLGVTPGRYRSAVA